MLRHLRQAGSANKTFIVVYYYKCRCFFYCIAAKLIKELMGNG